MGREVIVVTGACGFLGSAVTVDLARDREVVAVDRRPPSRGLRRAAPAVRWYQADIADGGLVERLMRRVRQTWGRIDWVIHFAAFYHFGRDWRREYEQTNVGGTRHILQSAVASGARRVIFASSLAALEPPPRGGVLTERSPASGFLPYARSKALGEEMVRKMCQHLPAIVLRIGGVFSDWCELPPLASLIRLWSGPWPFARMVVGRGLSGMPYIHRRDMVQLVRACLERRSWPKPYEVLLACQRGAVRHIELFRALRRACPQGGEVSPLFVPVRLARCGLLLRRALGTLVGCRPYEHLWMLDYVDRPWVADTSYTNRLLKWECTPELSLLRRMPVLLAHFAGHRRRWEEYNRMRQDGEYEYHESEEQGERVTAACAAVTNGARRGGPRGGLPSC